MPIQVIIFDLDGVIVSTDEFHYQGWQKLADEEQIYFDRTINHRLRGVSRMQSLEILLERASRRYTDRQKLAMAERKNGYYRELLKTITPADILPGVKPLLAELKQRGIRIAIASSSKNAGMILQQIGMGGYFDTVVDGNDITRSKPDPQVFTIAAQRLGLRAEQCLIVEDAEAGVEAALAGGMPVLAVGAACIDPRATRRAKDLSQVSAADLVE